jgi:hypothetical protein
VRVTATTPQRALFGARRLKAPRAHFVAHQSRHRQSKGCLWRLVLVAHMTKAATVSNARPLEDLGASLTKRP